MMIGPPVVTKLNRSLRLTRTSEESKDRGLARQLPSYTFPILSMYAESLRPSARVRRHRRSRVPPALSHPRTTSDLVPPGTHLISSYLVSSHLMLSHRIASRLISSYLVLSRGAVCSSSCGTASRASPQSSRRSLPSKHSPSRLAPRPTLHSAAPAARSHRPTRLPTSTSPGQGTKSLTENRNGPPPPHFPPVLTGHVSSLLPY